MKKLENIQQNKLISSYGGVGSIIETNTNGALLIRPYDEWPCFENDRWRDCGEVKDPRLLAYVKTMGYPHLNQFISIPIPELEDNISKYATKKKDIIKTVGAKFFPEWYYCPTCRRLKKLSVWRADWENDNSLDNKFNENEPACNHCSQNRGHGIHRHKLQQVRFVMVDMLTGDLKDIPFDKLWVNPPSDKAWQLSENGICSELYYKTTDNSDGLSGIYITAKINGADRIIRLSQIDANYLIEPGEEANLYGDGRPPVAYKMAMRGSQSLYIPNIVRSLYIPFNQTVDKAALTEDEMDIQEFRYLIDDSHYIKDRLVEANLDLIAARKNFQNLPKFISRITALERLKETSVMLSYSRFANYTEQRTWYDVNDRQERLDMRPGSQKPFSDKTLRNLTWMPAVEAFGEGILFELNLETVSPDKRLSFAHTFCHIVMKEMEFQCGYPLTSLKEKIFIDNENETAGFLIYTIAGSEGSYGGLVSLTDEGRIIKLIERGAERAKHCTNDPICINEGDSHCYACLDLPETSCVKFNQDLNRKSFLNFYFAHKDYQKNLKDNIAELIDDQNTEHINPKKDILPGITLA